MYISQASKCHDFLRFRSSPFDLFFRIDSFYLAGKLGRLYFSPKPTNLRDGHREMEWSEIRIGFRVAESSLSGAPRCFGGYLYCDQSTRRPSSVLPG